MTSSRTLIVYASKMGASAQSAQEIAEVLRKEYGILVDIVDLRAASKPDIGKYGNIIIGSGVRMGKIYSDFLNFVENDFSGKRIVIYISSAESAEPGKREEAIKKYVLDNLTNFPNLKPIAIEAFGGKLNFLGMTLWNNYDKKKVGEWAKEIGKKLIG
ncbi:MAG: flavodoxin domain-containing protein [Candidatus Micrarchaeota archaeon]